MLVCQLCAEGAVQFCCILICAHQKAFIWPQPERASVPADRKSICLLWQGCAEMPTHDFAYISAVAQIHQPLRVIVYLQAIFLPTLRVWHLSGQCGRLALLRIGFSLRHLTGLLSHHKN